METTKAMENSVTLKLFVDSKSGRIVFAEAGKDFVDFLFSLFTLPLGSVSRLLTSQDMVGCFGRLYQSLEILSDTCIQPYQKKNYLLHPKTLSTLTGPDPPLLLQSHTQFYMCGYDHGGGNIAYVTDIKNRICPGCGLYMSTVVAYLGTDTGSVASGGEGGYVKGNVTYIVTDDLVVTQLPNDSIMFTLDLLNKFNVNHVSAIKEKVVKVGLNEGLAFLKASLQSTTVLNDVFLVKQEK